MSVIQRDFGKKSRETVQGFRARLSLEATHEANIRANPMPYLERASERIFQLEKALFEAGQVFEADQTAADCGETLSIKRADYERLLRCKAIVEQALADYVSDGAA